MYMPEMPKTQVLHVIMLEAEKHVDTGEWRHMWFRVSGLGLLRLLCVQIYDIQKYEGVYIRL